MDQNFNLIKKNYQTFKSDNMLPIFIPSNEYIALSVETAQNK